MLVLSRKLGERIVIGSNIELQVVEIRGHRVRLGLIAPLDVPIHRAEVPRRRAEAFSGREEGEPCAVALVDERPALPATVLC